MNRLNNIARRTVSALFAALVLIFALSAARAQTPTPPSIAPLIDCIGTDSSGATTAFFGYTSTYEYRQIILIGQRNYFSPASPNQGEPTSFDLGEHHAAFSVSFYLADFPALDWNLDGKRVTVAADSPQCRTGAVTYQGKLSASGAQASGNYDLQFRLYNDPTGGAAIGALVTAANMQVVNGVFTVPLEFGTSALATPAKLYLQISVKPAGAAGSYTTLQPRQPLSSAPTAAFVTVSGRVSTPEGGGLRNARVALTDQNGNTRTVLTILSVENLVFTAIFRRRVSLFFDFGFVPHQTGGH